MLRWLMVLALLEVAASFACGYRILCVFPVPSASHNLLGRGLVTSLLSAGHQVTWATPYPENSTDENLKIIDVSATRQLITKVSMQQRTSSLTGMTFVNQYGRDIARIALETEDLRNALVTNTYDAVVTEWFFSDVQAGIAAIQQCPWIVLNGMVLHPHAEYLMDVYQSPAVLPFMKSDYGVPMTFWERVKNTAFVATMVIENAVSDQPACEYLYHKLFAPLARARGVALPAYPAARHNISVMFVNSHNSICTPFSMPPNVVEIGGYHISDETPPLPRDLQTLLDDSPQGVVYFSMGSTVKSSSFPVRTRQAVLKVLGELPYTVLWKFEEELEDVPKNVHIRAWMPQSSILAHPNIKLFITHGGLLSGLEAIHYGVPLLAIPLFGDQPSNAASAVRRGYALKVKFGEDMGPELKEQLDEMLDNKIYINTARRLSKVFRKRPVPAKHLIVHYTELAIESGGATHLRSKALLYSWYERLLLDQIVLLFIAIYVVYKIVRNGAKTLFGTRHFKEKNN